MNTFINDDTGETLYAEDLPLFATPIIVTKYNNHNDHEFEAFKKVDRKPESWFTSVNTTFPDVKLDDPYISSDLVEEVKKGLLNHTKKVMDAYNMPADIRFSSFWYNAYYEGQGQEPHNHLSPNNINPFWCGIYFAKNCFDGQLTFSKTDYSLRTQQVCDWNVSNVNGYYNELFIANIPNGHVVYFPPHLQHCVQVGKENRHKMRLTFSFNLAINRDAYLPDEYFRNEPVSSRVGNSSA